MARTGDVMRTPLTLVVAFASLGLWVALDRAIDISSGIPQVSISPPSRIWLAMASMILFAAFNLWIASLALAREGMRKWAAFLLLLVGTVGAIYLPVWSLGIPGLSRLLSVRSNPLISILASGGMLSLLKLQLASFVVIGAAALLRRHMPQASESPNAA